MCDPATSYPRLELAWASRSQLVQRAGRAGRVAGGGRAFRLAPQAFCELLEQEHRPEIQRSPLTKVVLDVKQLDMGSPREVLGLAMDPPDLASIAGTVVELQELGALLTTVQGQRVRGDGDLTVLGEVVARLPLDVRLGKLVVLGHIFGLLNEAITIAVGLNGKSIFTAPFHQRVQAYRHKLEWGGGLWSDGLAVLRAAQEWRRCRRREEFRREEEAWCAAHFLQRKQLEEMEVAAGEVARHLEVLGIRPVEGLGRVRWAGERKLLVLQLAMFGAFYPNYFLKANSYEVAELAWRKVEGRDPRTTVYLHGFPQDQARLGALYTRQVRQLFAAVTADTERLKVSYSGQHVFVEFERGLEEQGRSEASGGGREGRAGRRCRGAHGGGQHPGELTSHPAP